MYLSIGVPSHTSL